MEGDTMTGSQTAAGEVLAMSRAAVMRIEHEGIRADLGRLVEGAEKCLEADEVYLALEAARMIVSTVVALDRTLGHDITLGILDGLALDTEQTAIAMQRGLGFTKNYESKCDIKAGSPIGTSSCVDAKNSVCYTLSGGSGCGSSSGGFQFVWDGAIARR